MTLKRSYYDAGELLSEEDDDEMIEDGTADYSSIASNFVDAQNDEVDDQILDPIDMLTVARLKEVLRAQGLMTSGAKGVLKERLKDHVNSLLQKENK